ncbi:hypothetical protein Tco_1337721 [Tanacetum coccineum]
MNEGKHSRTSSSKEMENDKDMIQELTEEYMDHLEHGKSKGTAKNNNEKSPLKLGGASSNLQSWPLIPSPSSNPLDHFHVFSTSESIENVTWDDASGSHVVRLEGMSGVVSVVGG